MVEKEISMFGCNLSDSFPGASLLPALDLTRIFGEESVYCPCTSPNARRWLPSGQAVLNGLTGRQLVLAGSMPVLCSRGVSSGPALQLLRDAGLPVPSRIYKFSTNEEYLALLQRLLSAGRQIVVNHSHPINELPAGKCWVPPGLVNFLNNKANLGEIAPAAHVPERCLLTMKQLRRDLDKFEYPLVIKAAVNESSGGGGDVKICRSRLDVDKCLSAEFSGVEQLVKEEYLPEFLNLCLNYALTADGRVVCCGCAEQVSDNEGMYRGNWLDRNLKLPELVFTVGDFIAGQGAVLGYYGFLGIDIALLPDGRVMAFDLNFRANGSTTALLLEESIARFSGKSVMRVHSWRSRAGYRHILKTAYSLLQKGSFVPFWSYDPRADGLHDFEARLGGVLIGSAREEILELELEIAGLGLE
ncbi:MAG: hypothetical protein DRH04_07250 [Deltaproteobacteria bacterium]|nr:MAG: hypothetical protein DRH04_07250 [Deltaproteobacteria bacterium]